MSLCAKRGRRKAKAVTPSQDLSKARKAITEALDSLIPAIEAITLDALKRAGSEGLTWAEWRDTFGSMNIPTQYLAQALSRLGPHGKNLWRQEYNFEKHNAVYIFVGKSVSNKKPTKKPAATKVRKSLVRKGH